MDRRKEPRFEADQEVLVQTLDEAALRLSGRIQNVSGAGMRLMLDRLLNPGTPVRVDAQDMLLLGEVCYSEPTGEGYATGLKLQHALNHLQELTNLVCGVMGRPPHSLVPADR